MLHGANAIDQVRSPRKTIVIICGLCGLNFGLLMMVRVLMNCLMPA